MFPVPEIAQIQALLAAHLAGADGWDDQHLGAGVLPSQVPFSQIFTVTEDQLVQHVLQHGWDLRVVRPLDQAPATHQPWLDDVVAFAGPDIDGTWRCLLPRDPERSNTLYESHAFPDREALVRWLVAHLFALQRRFFA